MNAKVYPLLILLAFLSLAIVPFVMHPQRQHNSLQSSHILDRAASAREVIRELEETN